jgi:thymidylate synthase
MNTVDKQYQGFLRKLIMYGKDKEDRTGTGTISYFGETFRHDMSNGFPLLTTKKVAVKTMMTELKWFLKGDTNIKYLVDNNCHIWNGDAYKAYLRIPTNQLDERTFVHRMKTQDWFAKEWGELGPIYGKQWRDWNGKDQIKELIKNIKENPNSRRLMVSAWNVGELDDVVLPPCHYGFQCYVRDGKYLSLMWNQRSVDTFLGLPFNIASYATLLCLIAKEVDMIPDQLIGNLGDVHLYSNHVKQATEQLSREMYDLPNVSFSNVDLLRGEFDYEVHDYEYHPTIKAPLSN